jgi:hypothetical protein
MARTQNFPGDFKSKSHQLNGNHFHGPVSFHAPDDKDGYLPKPTHSISRSDYLVRTHAEVGEIDDSGRIGILNLEG